MKDFNAKVKNLYANAILIGINHSDPDNNAVPLGSSKVGGCPDLSPGISWPKVERDPGETTKGSIDFIAQINLADVGSFDRDQLLPPEGLLSFFVESPGEALGGYS